MNFTFYPFNYKGFKKVENNKCVIRTHLGHLCGYVAFNVSDIPKDWAGNYNAPGLQHLNVHGGLTFASVKGDYAVFGFDCAHAGDDERPELSDVDYVMSLAQQMEDQLNLFKTEYARYKRVTDKTKAKIIDAIREKAPIKCEFGFRSIIKMLSGSL